MTKQELTNLKRHLTIYGGATLNHNGKMSIKKDGFMVSQKAHEKVLKSIEQIELKTINNYLLLATKSNKANKTYKVFVGLWVDSETSKVYLDISYKINNKGVALQVAKQEQQLAIYDNAKCECISMR